MSTATIQVFAVDALVIINQINSRVTGNLAAPTSNNSSPPFYDMTGDNLLAAIDVLHAINFINEQADGEGKGETTALALPSPPFETASPHVFTASRHLTFSSSEPREPAPKPLTSDRTSAVSPKDGTSSPIKTMVGDDWDDLFDELALEWLTFLKGE